MSLPGGSKVGRTILLEEAFGTSAFFAGLGEQQARLQQAVMPALLDLGRGRIAAMDEAGVDVQVLSLTAPGVEQLDPAAQAPLARETNDSLAAAVKKHPDRFLGFAALPVGDPATAATELERAVRQLGMKGAIINGHTQGRYLDDPAFAPLLARAESLDVPIYLHPTMPPPAVKAASYDGHFASSVAFMLAGPAWGWHLETGTHVLRMILGGVFDRFPRLQIIVGHMGEVLPYMMPRIESVLRRVELKLERPLRRYFRENLYYTFSGFNYAGMFHTLQAAVGIDRILFSADHPYAPMDEAMRFLSLLDVSDEDREQIAHGNTERLLRLQ